jgi:hypothetical protein
MDRFVARAQLLEKFISQKSREKMIETGAHQGIFAITSTLFGIRVVNHHEGIIQPVS